MRYGLLAAILIVAILGGAALLLGSGNNNFPAESGTTSLTNDEGAVTVSINYLDGTDSEYADYTVFSVSMNTHSVNLDGYNMEELSYLKDSNNQKYLPSKWIEDEGSGGHHRSGTLLFPKYAENGDPIVDSDDSYFEIVVNEVGGVAERNFRVEL